MINERIRFPQVRVIDDQNQQLGVMATRDALDLARDRDLDLIVVAPQAQPPVCRIMDYGKFKYEKSKREKEAHKKSASTEMKTVRLKPVTSQNDREVLIKHTDRFLRSGHKVRVICRFQGRQNAHPEIGRGQLDAVAEALSGISTVEGHIVKQGRDMMMNLSPRPGIKPLPKAVKDDGKKGRKDGEEHDEDAEFARLQESMMGDDIHDDEHHDDADIEGGADVESSGEEASVPENSGAEDDKQASA